MKKKEVLIGFVMDNIFNTPTTEEGVEFYNNMCAQPDESPQLGDYTPRDPFEHLDNDELIVLVNDRVRDLEYMMERYAEAEA